MGGRNAQHRCSTRFAAMLQDRLHVFLLPVLPLIYIYMYILATALLSIFFIIAVP